VWHKRDPPTPEEKKRDTGRSRGKKILAFGVCDPAYREKTNNGSRSKGFPPARENENSARLGCSKAVRRGRKKSILHTVYF